MVSMDVFASAFGFDAKSDDVWTALGKVSAVNADGTFSVLLGGSATPTSCEPYCLAKVGDIVFVAISKGRARAIACKGDELHLADTTQRIGDAGLDQCRHGLLTQRYTSYGANLEQGDFWVSGDTVTISFKFVLTSNVAVGYTNSAWSIPEEYAPPYPIEFPIFQTTTGWGDFYCGCAVLAYDGYVHWWSKAAGVVFGYVTYTRKPKNWEQPS